MSASLRGKAPRLRTQVAALQTGEIKTFGASSLSMPKGENVRVVLTLQTEPVTGQVYTYGLLAYGGRDIVPEEWRRPIVRVAANDAPATLLDLKRQLVDDLWSILEPVDAYNREHPEWRDQKTVQCFSFDSYEPALLRRVLLEMIGPDGGDGSTRERALRLFFHFQAPELLASDDHPANESFFPVVILTSVIRSLFALPVETTVRFADAVALLPSARPFTYRDKPRFAFRLSNQLRSDAIFYAWRRGDTENLATIERELQFRLRATSSLINGIREHLDARPDGSSLFAWPPKFLLPASLEFAHPVLSKLAFLLTYESMVAYEAVRTRRTRPLEERLLGGDALRVKYLGGEGGPWFALDDLHVDEEISADGWPNRLLSEEGDTGQRAQMAFSDYGWRMRPYLPKQLPLALVSIAHADPPGERGRRLALGVQPTAAMPELRKGRRYVLDARFTDWTTQRALAELREIDQAEDPLFVRLVTDPASVRLRLKDGGRVRAVALQLARTHGMTASQERAFVKVLDHSVELVWGPPGTGKTHFLALSILCLAEAHRRAGRPLRIGLTAFTHAAIDNALRKVADLQASKRVFGGKLPIAKMGATSGLAGMEQVTQIAPEEGREWLRENRIVVVGGTVWAMQKGFDPATLDVLVIDEGSQLRLGESAIAVRRLRSGGRLVVAGDHLQLPPIVQGSYPDPSPSEPVLHRSIFECLRAHDGSEGFTSMLLENFRSNRTICRYPAEQIYVPEYTSVDDIVGSRQLSVRLPSRREDPDGLLGALLDPAYPLVVCVLEGVRATAENRVEAELVARTALALRSGLRAGGGRRGYPRGAAGDAAFWREGLFIVSPHHAQIHEIKRRLRAGRRWDSEPFVGTVDKMQGQECEAVITSYGVSDVEYALGEKEFIYSLNRLNVAITRARSKSIVFLPKPLLEPPVQAFDDESMAEGIAFMQGLFNFARRESPERVFALTHTPGAHLRVYPVPTAAR